MDNNKVFHLASLVPTIISPFLFQAQESIVICNGGLFMLMDKILMSCPDILQYLLSDLICIWSLNDFPYLAHLTIWYSYDLGIRLRNIMVFQFQKLDIFLLGAL